ncbi:SWIM zinc finger domain-containing protein [Chlorobaculum sp. 24CR]|uniref:SWIM zinc finger family protein n=1 Tax=Chlorobaculum sp. 24CR TaxID=2508878 RepID=UPI00100B39CC|nr:SWIM zinc finger family protein [Chlorobaculum sp. 24CR]RXK82718.1 SWIM zinc finger domain-containing protein [Chlorobaculum sp. 24CR]
MLRRRFLSGNPIPLDAMPSIHASLNGFTEKEIADWAGSTIYARGKSYIDDVTELSRTEDGRLAAWVFGSDEYVTTVRRGGKGEFDFACTCPYDHGGPCKHVVAVLLVALARAKRGEEIPVLQPDDELYLELADYLDGETDDDEPGDERGGSAASSVESMLAGKSREELLEIMADVTRNFPEVTRWLGEREQLATGKIDQLIHALRKEIFALTAIDAWPVYGDFFEDSPDYSGVQQRLQNLLDRGHADAVFGLGEELWSRCGGQLESFEDDGMIASGIAGCMQVVLKALPDTKLSRLDQLVWLHDRLREDQFDLLAGADMLIGSRRYAVADWRELAAALEARLANMPVSTGGRRDEHYRRRHVVDQLIDVYRRGGEAEKVIPLLEKEADPCLYHDVLVEHLLAAGVVERARSWCIEGYGKTVEQAPGIASMLQRHLRELAEKEGNLALVAAYRAQDFFRYPSVGAFSELREASEKIDAWPAVREAALGYLRTGRRPDGSATGGAWPLPKPEVGSAVTSAKTGLRSFPKLAVLIEIAILEARRDDTVALFKELCQTGMCGRDISEKVAESVATSHPDIALKIWRITVDNLIAEVKTSAYEEATGYLRKMRSVWRQTDRLEEWSALIAELRTRHKAKRNLMSLLKKMEQDGD